MARFAARLRESADPTRAATPTGGHALHSTSRLSWSHRTQQGPLHDEHWRGTISEELLVVVLQLGLAPHRQGAHCGVHAQAHAAASARAVATSSENGAATAANICMAIMRVTAYAL